VSSKSNNRNENRLATITVSPLKLSQLRKIEVWRGAPAGAGVEGSGDMKIQVRVLARDDLLVREPRPVARGSRG
jgi:hypothetical protein